MMCDKNVGTENIYRQQAPFLVDHISYMYIYSLLQVHRVDSTTHPLVEGRVFSPVGVPMAATRSLVGVCTADNVAMVIRGATCGVDQPVR